MTKMKTTYIAPEMTVVRLQHHSIICASPNNLDGQNVSTFSSGGGTVNEESSVWTKESHNVWDEEW